ncbi:hypothetical protein XENOCAPTIV_008944, partial [Xenoophorus captivus]
FFAAPCQCGEEDHVVTLFNCSVGRSDCSRCRTADPKYGCVWCGEHSIMVRFGGAERHLQGLVGGRIIKVDGHNLDVVQEPKMRVTLSPPDALPPRRRRSVGKKVKDHLNRGENHRGPLRRWRRIYESRCAVRNSTLILCPTPAVGSEAKGARVKVHFLLDSLHFDFSTVGGETFSYEPNPKLFALNRNDPSKPYHHKPGSIISVEVKMGNLNFSLGRVQYDIQAQSTFPLEAQVGVGVGASIVALIVLIIVLIYSLKTWRPVSGTAVRKSSQVPYFLLPSYAPSPEIKLRNPTRFFIHFVDLMTEMMDMSSDLVGSGIPFLDYRAYAERIFFPGHQESPLRRDLDVPESRRQTVEQGLVQLSNLLNSKLFLTKVNHSRLFST